MGVVHFKIVVVSLEEIHAHNVIPRWE